MKRLTHFINDEAVYRTAPATPGQLKSYDQTIQKCDQTQQKKIVTKLKKNILTKLKKYCD